MQWDGLAPARLARDISRSSTYAGSFSASGAQHGEGCTAGDSRNESWIAARTSPRTAATEVSRSNDAEGDLRRLTLSSNIASGAWSPYHRRAPASAWALSVWWAESGSTRPSQPPWRIGVVLVQHRLHRCVSRRERVPFLASHGSCEGDQCIFRWAWTRRGLRAAMAQRRVRDHGSGKRERDQEWRWREER